MSYLLNLDKNHIYSGKLLDRYMMNASDASTHSLSSHHSFNLTIFKGGSRPSQAPSRHNELRECLAHALALLDFIQFALAHPLASPLMPVFHRSGFLSSPKLTPYNAKKILRQTHCLKSTIPRLLELGPDSLYEREDGLQSPTTVLLALFLEKIAESFPVVRILEIGSGLALRMATFEKGVVMLEFVNRAGCAGL